MELLVSFIGIWLLSPIVLGIILIVNGSSISSYKKRIAELYQEARALFAGRASLTCSKPYFLECNPLRATKGNALKWCAGHFGFDMSELLAFGDSLNDVSMLEAAGTGIAMGNAREDVKAMGFPLCGSNAEDGVARYIDEHILR